MTVICVKYSVDTYVKNNSRKYYKTALILIIEIYVLNSILPLTRRSTAMVTVKIKLNIPFG